MLNLCWCVTVNQIPPPQSCCCCDGALPHLQQFLLQTADAEGQCQRRQRQGRVSNNNKREQILNTVLWILCRFRSGEADFFLRPLFIFWPRSDVRNRGGIKEWRHGHVMWTSSKRTFCLCLSIRSKLKSVRLPQFFPLYVFMHYISCDPLEHIGI